MDLMPKKITGLDIDEGRVAAVELASKSKRVSLIRQKIAPSIQAAKEDFIKKEEGIVVNLPTQALLFRTFHVASSFLRSKNRERDLVNFLEHQNLPFKLAECFWDTFAWDSTLIFVAAKIEALEKFAAQIEEAGLHISSITASQIALYNVFIYNYPEEKDKFALLNIRNSASDLLIYEDKRVLIYPLSLGKRDITETTDKREDKKEKFAIEVQKLFNAHYLRYPMTNTKIPNRLYISGQDSSYGLVFALKKALGDFEVKVLDPFRKIDAPAKEAIESPEALALGCGLALAYLGEPGCISINLFKSKLKERQVVLRFNLLKTASVVGGVVSFVLLLLFYRSLFKDFERYIFMYNATEFQVSRLLPQVKNIKEKKDTLEKFRDYLKNRLTQQKIYYLKALAVIAESKPASAKINNFTAEVVQPKEAKQKSSAPVQPAKTIRVESKEIVVPKGDIRLQVFVSGSAPNYEEISMFLTKIKKGKDVREARIVASTFPTFGSEMKAIEFKLGFEMVVSAIKDESGQGAPAGFRKASASGQRL